MTVRTPLNPIQGQNIYWTIDSEDGCIEQEARLRVAKDEQTAKAECIKRMQKLVDPAYEFEAVQVDGIERYSPVPSHFDLAQLQRHVAECGLYMEDIVLYYDDRERPDEVWIEVRAPVFTARETGRILGNWK